MRKAIIQVMGKPVGWVEVSQPALIGREIQDIINKLNFSSTNHELTRFLSSVRKVFAGAITFKNTVGCAALTLPAKNKPTLSFLWTVLKDEIDLRVLYLVPDLSSDNSFLGFHIVEDACGGSAIHATKRFKLCG